MNTRRRLLGGAAAALCMGLAVSACSGDQDADTLPAGSSGSSGSATSTPAPGDSDAPAPGRVVPAACSALTLVPGATLDGAGLGECVAQALVSFGSGRMELVGDTYGELEFAYDPGYSFQGELTGPEGPVDWTYVDGQMWVDSGNGPVKGDVNSTDPEEMAAGIAAAMFLAYSDPAQAASLVAAQPTWTVDQTRDPLQLPDGSTVESYKIANDAPFVWNGLTVNSYILWYGDDWVPTRAQATMGPEGLLATNSQEYYDLGAPVTITPPN